MVKDEYEAKFLIAIQQAEQRGDYEFAEALRKDLDYYIKLRDEEL